MVMTPAMAAQLWGLHLISKVYTYSSRNACSESRHGLRVTICPRRAVTIGSGLVDTVGTSRKGDLTAGISDHCR
jgi:hypothetical protein